MVINAVGAVCTFVVMIVFAVTKFRDGAWVVVVLMPALVLRLLQHPSALRATWRSQLSLDKYGAPPRIGRHRVIIPIGGVHRGSLAALAYARALSSDVTAVHVSLDPAEAEKIRQQMGDLG